MKVHIVGGGFSGLTLAYFLTQKKIDVVVYEKDHLGGCIHTIQHRGALIETAANGFLVSQCFEDLSSVVGASLRGVEGPQGRFIYSDNKPRKWPLRFLENIPLAGFILKFLFVKNKLMPLRKESVALWAQRTLSSSILRKLIEPALRGIYAGDVERLSAPLIVGKMFKKEERPLKGKRRGLTTGQLGMEGWLKDVVAYLEKQGVEFRREKVSDLSPLLSTGDRVVLATPPAAAAELLQPLNDKRSEILAKIEMLPVASVTVLTENPAPLQGFGCLFPAAEKFSSLGVLFRQCFFPEKAAPHQERWILGWKGESDGELLIQVEKDRDRLWLKKAPRIHAHHVKVWPQALPHYTTDLEAQIEHLEDRNSKVYLHGNYLGALGLTALLEKSFKLAETLSER